MPKFVYIAVDTEGSVVNGSMEQVSRSSVISSLTRQNMRPISVKEDKKRKISFNLDQILGKRRVKSDELVIFTRQLSTMISAGVPLLRALSALSGHVQDSPALKSILTNIISDIEGGSPLGDALQKHPDTFSDVYVNMVRAGEAAGILDDILKRLAYQQEKNMTMRKKIRSAMTYPSVLIVITILAFFGLMIFVIPRIGGILEDIGGPDTTLPGITLFMLAISNFTISYWYLVFIALGAGGYFGRKYIKTTNGKEQFHSLLLKIPSVKVIVQKVAVARFTRTFSALVGAGVNVLEALDVTSRAVGNAIYEKALKEAAEEIKNGKTLSNAISQSDLFPPIVSQMLLVGEETGKTDVVLVKVADFYEEEVDVAIEGLSSIIEPAMIVVMGAVVGLIAASVMVPIAGLAQNIQ
jgi:type IV pilus assembly protein PilC